MIQLSISDISDLFSFVETDTNTVLWIRNANYQKQLFVSKNYEIYFGQSTNALYEYPNSWFERVNFDRSGENIQDKRLQENSVTLSYQAIGIDGQLSQVRDKSFIVYDTKGTQPIAVIGIAKCEHNQNLSDNALNRQIDSIENTEHIIKTILKTQSINSHPVQKIKLSSREKECLSHLVLGDTAKKCAIKMHISNRTVEYYIENIKNKLGVCSRSEIIAAVYTQNLLELD